MFERFNGNVVPFADESTSTNRTVFGSETQSDDIDDNLNSDFKKGWEIVGLNDNPTREDFNAMGYTLGYLTSYLYQNGVAEYNLLQEYKTNSIAIGTDGNIYQSLVDNNLGNALTDTTKWVCIASKNSIVNSIAELKTISNIESINVLGYYEKGDGGGGTFYWDATSTETDNGGTIIQATGVTTGRWKRVFSGAVNVKWFGAKGDGITDDTVAIQNVFEMVKTVESNGFSDYNNNIGKTISIYLPKGLYITSNDLIIGRENEIMHNVEINFSTDAVIRRTSTTGGTVLKILNSSRCVFKNIQTQGYGCNGLEISQSLNCLYENIGSGSDHNFSLKLSGIIFNNIFSHTRLNQNQSINGSDYGLFMDFKTINSDTYYSDTGAPINNFNGLYISGAKTLIYGYCKNAVQINTWATGAIRFSTLELEGVTKAHIYMEGFRNPITFNNMWIEGNGSDRYDFSFLNCESVIVENSFMGSSSFKHLYQDCGSVSISNIIDGGKPMFKGTIGKLSIANCQFNHNNQKILIEDEYDFVTKRNDAIFGNVSISTTDIKSYYSAIINQTVSYNSTEKTLRLGTTNINNISADSTKIYLDNVVVNYINTSGENITRKFNTIVTLKNYVSDSEFYVYLNIQDYASAFTFIEGNVAQFNGEINTTNTLLNNYTYLADPRATTSPLYCTIADDVSYSNISPIGLKEKVITINSTTNFPSFKIPIVSTSIPSNAEVDAVLVTCMREDFLVESTVISQSKYISTIGTIYKLYGDFGYVVEKNGIRYVVFINKVKLTSATSDIQVVFNYNLKFDIGTKIAYGGSILMVGKEYPIVYGH